MGLFPKVLQDASAKPPSIGQDHSNIRENQVFSVVETVPETQRVCCRFDA